MITSVVAAKIWYLKNVQFLLGHPVYNSIGRRPTSEGGDIYRTHKHTNRGFSIYHRCMCVCACVGMHVFVAFFILLILLAENTPPASSTIPLIGTLCYNSGLRPVDSLGEHLFDK